MNQQNSPSVYHMPMKSLEVVFLFFLLAPKCSLTSLIMSIIPTERYVAQKKTRCSPIGEIWRNATPFKLKNSSNVIMDEILLTAKRLCHPDSVD